MEPRVKSQRSVNKGLHFTGPKTFLSWLRSPFGDELREAIERELLPNLAERLFDGSEESKRLQAEVIERADKTVRCVVTVQPLENGEVWVEVHGPQELRAKIVRLPVVPESMPALQGLVEKLVEVEAGKTFRRLLEDGRMRERAILIRRYFSFWEWVAAEKKRLATMALSEAITETMAEVFPELRKRGRK